MGIVRRINTGEPESTIHVMSDREQNLNDNQARYGMQAHRKVSRLKVGHGGHPLEEASHSSQPVRLNIVVNENYLV